MNIYPDPSVEIGAFRVLPRTTGGFVVIDTRRAPGNQTVHWFPTLEFATKTAQSWKDQGHG